MCQIVNDEVYVNNYSNMCKYDINMNKIWQNGMFIKYDDIIPAGEAFYDAWIDSGPIKTDAQGNTVKINSRQYNANDNNIGNKSGVSIIKYDTDGNIIWAYFLNQDYPTEAEIIANYDWVGNIYYNVWVDLGAGGIQVGPGTVDFTFISYNDMGDWSTPSRYARMGDDTGFFVSINMDGLTSGTVEIPLPLQEEYQQRASYTLYDNIDDLRDDSYGYTERFTSVAHPTFSAHGVTIGDSTLLTASVPVFTYEAKGIDFFYRETVMGSAATPNMRTGFL